MKLLFWLYNSRKFVLNRRTKHKNVFMLPWRTCYFYRSTSFLLTRLTTPRLYIIATARIPNIINCFSTMDHVLTKYQAAKQLSLISDFTRATFNTSQLSPTVTLLSLLSRRYLAWIQDLLLGQLCTEAKLCQYLWDSKKGKILDPLFSDVN